jgi:YHS domain-containing protein
MKKTTQYLVLSACLLGLAAFSSPAAAQGCAMGSCCPGAALAAVSDATTNAIPDLLKTCPVSGDKLGTDMGDPFVFVYQGQEVKLCCKGCKKDFDKNPAKYIKLIRAADKNAGKK